MEGEAQEDEEVEEEVDMEDKVEELDEEEMEGLLVGMWARQSQHWRSIAAWGSKLSANCGIACFSLQISSCIRSDQRKIILLCLCWCTSSSSPCRVPPSESVSL